MISCFPSQKGINEHTGPLSFPSAPICQQASVYGFSCLLTNTLAISNSNLTCSPLMAIQSSMPDGGGCGGWELAWKTAWEGRQKREQSNHGFMSTILNLCSFVCLSYLFLVELCQVQDQKEIVFPFDSVHVLPTKSLYDTCLICLDDANVCQ